jgi:RES domain-containing protein
MQVYRIASCKYIDNLTGAGAAMYGGRWNSIQVYMLYTASSPSLALLETLVHMTNIPKEGFCMMKLMIPEDKMKEVNENELPDDWATYPAPDQLKIIGDQFIRDNKFLALIIPSAIMPEEKNILLNPNHPDFKKVKVIFKRNLKVDKRLKEKTKKEGSV